MNNPTDAIRPQEAAEAAVSGTWPNGEPSTVRKAAAAPTRPTWLAKLPCPSWCADRDSGMHREHDHFDDRLHIGAGRAVVLTAADECQARESEPPDEARMFLRQHYREVEARIELGRDDKPVGIQLTLDEAEEFAAKLLDLVSLARAATSVSEEEVPIAERSSGPLSAWVWGSSGRVDVFRDERRPDWERPLTPDEAEEFGRHLVELATTARDQ